MSTLGWCRFVHPKLKSQKLCNYKHDLHSGNIYHSHIVLWLLSMELKKITNGASFRRRSTKLNYISASSTILGAMCLFKINSGSQFLFWFNHWPPNRSEGVQQYCIWTAIYGRQQPFPKTATHIKKSWYSRLHVCCQKGRLVWEIFCS